MGAGLVCTKRPVVVKRTGHAVYTVLGRTCSIAALDAEPMPRGMLLTCFVCFLSFVSAAQDFSGYPVRWDVA